MNSIFSTGIVFYKLTVCVIVGYRIGYVFYKHDIHAKMIVPARLYFIRIFTKMQKSRNAKDIQQLFNLLQYKIELVHSRHGRKHVKAFRERLT